MKPFAAIKINVVDEYLKVVQYAKWNRLQNNNKYYDPIFKNLYTTIIVSNY